MIQINTKRVLLGILVVLIPTTAITTSVYLFLRSQSVKGVSVSRVRDTRLVPYIANLAPNTAYVGEEYVFVPKIVSEEGASLSILEGPEWLSINSENMIVGTPLKKDIGSVKLVLKVSDSYNSSTSIEYLIVKDNEEVDSNN